MKILERRLGLFAVVSISISSMVGSGIFVLPGIGFQMTGASLWLAFLLSAICILPAALSKAELATAMPASGGTYIYIDRTFGPFAGTIVGLGLFISILLKASFSLVGIASYFSVLSSFPLAPTVISFLCAICFLNILGVGKVSGFMTIILFVTVTSLCFISAYSIPMWYPENLEPLMNNGLNGLASATALVFVSFAGVTKVAAIAEEVKNPEKNLPRGILLSLFLVTILYCLTSFVLAGVFETSQIAGDLKPIHSLATKIGGSVFGTIMAIIAVFTMVNTSNAGVLAGSRFPFAMSRDKLLPPFLGKLHPKFYTPVLSIIVSCLIIAGIVLTLDVTKIAKLASAFMIMIYMLENIAVIVLRETHTTWYKPTYKSPLYPFVQILGIIASLCLLYAMGILSVIAILAIGIPGCFIYFFYSRHRMERKGVIGLKGKRTDLTSSSITIPGPHKLKDAEVVVGLFGQEASAEVLIEVALSMVEDNHLEVARILEVPEQTMADDVEEPTHLKSLRRRVNAMAEDKGVDIAFDAVISHDMAKTIFEISTRVHCKWLFIEWQKKMRGNITFSNPVGWLKSHLHCNLATFKDNGCRYFRKIMVLLNEDKNDDVVIDTAQHMSQLYGAQISSYHYKKDSSVLSVKDVVELTAKYDLLILGSADQSFIQNFIQTDDEKIFQKSICSVIGIHKSSFTE